MVITRSTGLEPSGQPPETSAATSTNQPVVTSEAPTLPSTVVTATSATTTNTATTTVTAGQPPRFFTGAEDVSFLSSETTSPSPNFSMLTGDRHEAAILNVREQHAGSEAVSTGVREIINSAVGFARLELRREEDERLRLLIPHIIEETRLALVGAPVGANATGLQEQSSAANEEQVRAQTNSVVNVPMNSNPQATVNYAFTQPPPLPSWSQPPAYRPPPVYSQTSAHTTAFPQFPPTMPRPQSSIFGPPPGLGPKTHSWQSSNENHLHPSYAQQRQQPQNIAQLGFGQQQPPPMSNQHFRPPSHQNFVTQSPYNHTESAGKWNLAKWGIKFDGTDKTINIQEFIFRVREMKRDFNCPDIEFLTKFHQLLEKPALDWYWNQRKFVQFRSQILNRRQLPQESFEDFFNAVMKLRNQQKTPYLGIYCFPE